MFEELGRAAVAGAAGLTKVSARRSTKILRDLMEQDPTGASTNEMIQQLYARGAEPRRFIKELGTGQEGVADLVALPPRKGYTQTIGDGSGAYTYKEIPGKPAQLAAEKTYLPDTFFTQPAALRRKERYLREMTEQRPDLIAGLLGTRDIEGVNPTRAFAHEFIPGPELRDIPEIEDTPAGRALAERLKGEGAPQVLPAGGRADVRKDMRERVARAEKELGTESRASDIHGGNIRYDAEGNPRVVDVLAIPQDDWGNLSTWGFESTRDAPARYGRGSWVDPHLARVSDRRKPRLGGAMKANIYRGEDMNRILYPEGGPQFGRYPSPEALQRDVQDRREMLAREFEQRRRQWMAEGGAATPNLPQDVPGEDVADLSAGDRAMSWVQRMARRAGVMG